MSTRDLSVEPVEEQVHAAVETLLRAGLGLTTELYHPPDAVVRVPIPSIQYLVDRKDGGVIYMITPQSDALYAVRDTCTDDVDTAVIITAAMNWGRHNEPQKPGFVPRFRVQMRMLEDLRYLLNGKDVTNDATLRITGRNLDGLDAEAWTAVQAIFGLAYGDT